MNTRADTAASTKGKLITPGVVRVGGGISKGLEVILVAVRVETAGLGVTCGVHVDAPDVVDNTSIFRDKVAVIVVILGYSVGDSTHDGGGHPAEGLLDNSADILEVTLVIHVGETVLANDAINLSLSLLLDFRVEEHSLDEGIEGGRGSVRAGLEESSRDVSRLVIGKSLGLLSGDELLGEAALDGSGESVLLSLEPVGKVQFLLSLVERLSLAADREEEVREVAKDGEEVNEGGKTSLVELGELGETVKELLHLGVIVGGGSPAEDHGGSQGIRVAADVVEEVVGVNDKIMEHLLVLKDLVGDVRLGGRDVE